MLHDDRHLSALANQGHMDFKGKMVAFTKRYANSIQSKVLTKKPCSKVQLNACASRVLICHHITTTVYPDLILNDTIMLCSTAGDVYAVK